MELNRDETTKALMCCYTKESGCEGCPFENDPSKCAMLGYNSFRLLLELIEENKKLRADTVRKMKERLKECFPDTVDEKAIYTAKCIMFAIDQVAKEMLEETKND